ncbi:formate dehydrogenase accessory protein FdhE [Anaeromyxobacter sp. Fw109-5]|uniref:formate dehydrogenase accessory protein FdhE n=1 Tax=Anaeromyxobacter sp. (strain Fw109-5) TaxID=404589 RepID=UPI0000ED8286|nr:formate dehydrogenase accessory protein FdhE [Anaeromyxobacter sp. Fw109-5]ABS26214.1 formate dehydrogenase accessory protein FdhE [Anaeromyxobacter sp. Fw109-5]
MSHPELPITPGDVPPPLRLPEARLLFRGRAERLEALAEGHAAGEWLRFLARLARGQDRAVREVAAAPPPRAEGGPPLAGALARRDPSWRDALRVVLAVAKDGALPGAAAAAIARLEGASPEALEALADEVVGGAPADLAAAPFVGAALQAHLARLAGGVSPTAVAPAGAMCPVCGGTPVASVVLGDARVRYIVCGLCGAEWHLPRAQCALCRQSGKLSYLEIEGGPPGVSAEACAGCHAYLKVVDLAEAHGADAVADDAATLVLDLLVGERGFLRAGMNPLAPAGERT